LVDPNDPNFNGNGPYDPCDWLPIYDRWADLTGGPDVYTGTLNSEILYFWRFLIYPIGADPNDPNNIEDFDAAFEWADPFRYWEVELTKVGGEPDSIVLEWYAWSTGDIYFAIPIHLEGINGGVARSLDLRKIKTEEYGTVSIDPDWTKYTRPMDSEITGLYKFPDGMGVVMTATKYEGRSFKKWKIWTDPADYPNNTSMVSDTNEVAYLLMDGDVVVEAVFGCSDSSGILPPIAIVLLVLALGVARRRMA
jgi:hypothetical protein